MTSDDNGSPVTRRELMDKLSAVDQKLNAARWEQRAWMLGLVLAYLWQADKLPDASTVGAHIWFW